MLQQSNQPTISAVHPDLRLVIDRRISLRNSAVLSTFVCLRQTIPCDTTSQWICLLPSRRNRNGKAMQKRLHVGAVKLPSRFSSENITVDDAEEWSVQAVRRTRTSSALRISSMTPTQTVCSLSGRAYIGRAIPAIWKSSTR